MVAVTGALYILSVRPREQQVAEKPYGEHLHHHKLVINTHIHDSITSLIIAGNHYPLYGVQWHPEKNPFEWTRELNIPHSAEAILASQYMEFFFINQGL